MRPSSLLLPCTLALAASLARPALVQSALAQGPGDARVVPATAARAAAAPRAIPAHRRVEAIAVDGRLDEASWAGATAAGDFTESYPNPNAPARLRTEARVLYDGDAVYVGMRMFDAAPDSIAAQLARRDATGIYSDWAQVMLDSYHDRRTGFVFAVNPLGVKRDVLLSNDNAEDLGWDAVWEVATRRDSLGWTAEFRIPYSQLRFARGEPAEGRTWGLQFSRDVARYQARYMWAPWVRSDNAFVSRFGTLTSLRGVRAPTQLEAVPYTLARLTRAPGIAANPFYRRSDVATAVGADLRLGLRSGFTLNAAINPDFGQVELDPAFVNLGAFEVQLPERRPFFVEGTDIFRFGGLTSYISQGTPQLFYSRRIGRAPQRSAMSEPGALFADAPTATTILGAAKLSGKTANGWSVGLLDAVTAREAAPFARADGTRGGAAVEPASNYLVARVRRDLSAGRTVLGAITTMAHRTLRDSVFGPSLRSDAYVAGVDGEHHWGNRMWAASGFLAGSHVDGSERAIAATQRAAARYYLRPDAGHLTYDSTRSTLGGYNAGAAIRKGGAWRGSVWYQEISPGFEANDLGFQSRADTRGLSSLFGRRQDRPGAVFRDWFVRGFTSHRWNFDGDILSESYALRGNGTLKSLWNVNATVERGNRTYDDRLTRGGPVGVVPGSWSYAAGFGTDPRKRFSAGMDAQLADDDAGGGGRFVSAYLQGRPTSAVQFTVSPFFDDSRAVAQYVRTRVDAGATATFGRRYVFATLNQKTVAMSTRLDWTFAPTVSLQLYARPFISSGAYRDLKELEAPRTFDFATYGVDRGTIATNQACGAASTASPRVYTIDPDGAGGSGCFQVANPDFTVRSLRGNAVLRWEYRPGSTVFLVWQQERAGDAADGSFDAWRETGELFRTPARNVFLVKASYWLSR